MELCISNISNVKPGGLAAGYSGLLWVLLAAE